MEILKVLTPKTKNPLIKEIKQKLHLLGMYKGSINELYSEDLIDIIKEYQLIWGLTPDSQIGEQTVNSVLNIENANVRNWSPTNFAVKHESFNDNQYVKSITEKEQIILYHTGPANTAFKISQDGTIIQRFDPKYWNFSLKGDGNIELNSIHIGIELENAGGLDRINNQYVDYKGNFINSESAFELEKPFRGFKYYQNYTKEQLLSAKKLINYLADKFSIRIQNGQFDLTWFEYQPEIRDGRLGVFTEVNVDEEKLGCYPNPSLMETLQKL